MSEKIVGKIYEFQSRKTEYCCTKRLGEMVAIALLVEEYTDIDSVQFMSIFRSTDWTARLCSTNCELSETSPRLSFAYDSGHSLLISKVEADYFSVIVGVESERRFFMFFKTPEHHTAKFDRLPTEKVEELINIFARGDGSEILDWTASINKVNKM